MNAFDLFWTFLPLVGIILTALFLVLREGGFFRAVYERLPQDEPEYESVEYIAPATAAQPYVKSAARIQMEQNPPEPTAGQLYVAGEMSYEDYLRSINPVEERRNRDAGVFAQAAIKLTQQGVRESQVDKYFHLRGLGYRPAEIPAVWPKLDGKAIADLEAYYQHYGASK
jgi:hypothetical protein